MYRNVFFLKQMLERLRHFVESFGEIPFSRISPISCFSPPPPLLSLQIDEGRNSWRSCLLLLFTAALALRGEEEEEGGFRGRAMPGEKGIHPMIWNVRKIYSDIHKSGRIPLFSCAIRANGVDHKGDGSGEGGMPAGREGGGGATKRQIELDGTRVFGMSVGGDTVSRVCHR